tara:strand:- start:324 stop:872 length:549 start_codon:yes stop_codon:yes gene_type:complete
MKSEPLFNIKEFFHLAFLLIAFVLMLFIFDFSSDTQRAQSLLIAGFIGAIYYFQTNQLNMQYWSFGDEKKETNYEIVGPFGMVFFVCWLAIIDYKTPEVVSKYTGFIILITILNAMAVNGELTKRAETRFVSDEKLMAFKVAVWVLFGLLYMAATCYFFTQGTWAWDIPSVLNLFELAFGLH